MPLNPNSHYLGLMRELNHLYREVKEEAVQTIRTVIICTLVLGIGGIIFGILVKNLAEIVLVILYIGWSIYFIIKVIPKQFNIKEIEDAIEGDTFAIMEVNVELVTLWVGKCNICLGRCQLIQIVYVPWTALFGLSLLILGL